MSRLVPLADVRIAVLLQRGWRECFAFVAGEVMVLLVGLAVYRVGVMANG